MKFTFSGGHKEKKGQQEYWYPKGDLEICEMEEGSSDASNDISKFLS